MSINTPSDFARALKQGPYVWPGGYPVFFVMEDGEPLSFEAAKKEARLICQAIRDGYRSGWRAVALEINWEDAGLVCAHTGKPIEAAYV